MCKFTVGLLVHAVIAARIILSAQRRDFKDKEESVVDA